MRAMVLTALGGIDSGTLRLMDVPDPVPGSGEVLIRVGACAACRTDLQICEGDIAPVVLPIIPGHQVVGRIEAIGPGAEGFSEGQRAGLTWLAGTCDECAHCRAGRENLCERATFTGWHRHGGFAELVTARADVVVPLPEGPRDSDLAPLLCGGVIGYRALRVAGITPGARVGLYGFGASARQAIQVARHLGCRVAVATRSNDDQARALAMGAEWAGGYTDHPPFPLDLAVTFAPAGSVVASAVKALDRGGTVTINAIHLDELPTMDYADLWWERTIRSVSNLTRADIRDYLALAARIPVVTTVEEFALADAARALQRIATGDVNGTAVIIP
ncbi:MAG: zinc-binding alcohol dehydrogenase family protein [Thermoleophilia bacterium]|nr:zinc-binding alcohol dehydrogenase family protein [Thermoleophilia bacterium]